MADYIPPKLKGNKVPLNNLVQPAQHERAWHAAHSVGISLADYVGALIDRDAGLPNLDHITSQEALPIAKAS